MRLANAMKANKGPELLWNLADEVGTSRRIQRLIGLVRFSGVIFEIVYQRKSSFRSISNVQANLAGFGWHPQR